MLRVLLVSVLLVAVKADDVNDLVGDWMPGVSYPKTGYAPYCYWNKITADDSLACTCDGKATPALKYLDTHTGDPMTFPTIFISETDDVASSLRTSCSCNGKPKSVVAIRKLSPDYFVDYHSEAPLDLTGKNEYYTTVHMKKAPKLSELQAVAGRVADLRGKELEYWCESSFFVSE